MKIYKIDIDQNETRLVLPDIEGLEILKYKIFDGKKKADFWKDSIWYIFNPTLTATNFLSFGTTSALVFDQKVYDSELYDILERAGEILPITIKKENYYVLNITEIINVLDEEKTTWELLEDNTKGDITEYSFLKNRFTNSSLFKIPETYTTEIFVHSDTKVFEEEFYTLYKKLNFTGLIFNKVYSE
ncbi:hypothetical protein [Kordia sp.]|uniref:hypothetical protein n=1 Tax=Kordia sp. TaxID=1965332 RepID=UPI003D28AD8C